MNLDHRKTNQKRVIGNFFYVHLGNYLPGHTFDKADNPVPGRTALFGAPPIPKLDFTWHRLLTMLDTLPPVFEYPRFLETISDSPVPHVTKLLEEGFPSP